MHASVPVCVCPRICTFVHLCTHRYCCGLSLVRWILCAQESGENFTGLHTGLSHFVSLDFVMMSYLMQILLSLLMREVLLLVHMHAHAHTPRTQTHMHRLA